MVIALASPASGVLVTHKGVCQQDADALTRPLEAGNADTDARTTLAGLEGFFTENMGQKGPGAGRFYVMGEPVSVSLGTSWMAFDLAGDGGGSLVRLTFDGARSVEPVGTDQLGHLSNFFIGNDPDGWVVGARNFRAVRYPSLYDGIDLVVRLDDGRLKYDFVLEPGARPSDISMSYAGAEGVRIDDGTGDLLITTAAGTIRDEGLWTYQDLPVGRSAVPSSFRMLEKRTVGVAVGRYDPSTRLVIDPRFNFSTLFGGSNNDGGLFMTVDSAGNTFIAGYTTSRDFPTTPGAYCQTISDYPFENGFIIKLNSDGSNLLFSTYMGGRGIDFLRQLRPDASGDLYVLGYSESDDFPTTPGVIQRTYGGNGDEIVSKLGGNGDRLILSTYLGGSETEYPWGLDIDESGNLHIVGWTASSDAPMATNGYDLSHNGGRDVYLLTMDHDCTQLLSGTFLGGTGNDAVDSIVDTVTGIRQVFDEEGSVYLTGATASIDFPTTTDAFKVSLDGPTDVWAAKLSHGGSDLIYSTYVGGGQVDYPYGLKVTEYGELYIAGCTESRDFPTTHGALDHTYNGIQDGFIAKLGPSGERLLLGTYFGGISEDHISAIGLDEDGHVYLGGWSEGTGLPVTENGDGWIGGAQDGFVCMLSSSCDEVLYCSYIGGTAADIVLDIDLSLGPANVTLYGATRSLDFPTTPGAYCRTPAGRQDLFVARIPIEPEVARLPSAPHNLSALVDLANDSIVVTWEPPLDSGGDLRVRGYRFYVGASEGGLDFERRYPNDTFRRVLSPVEYGRAYSIAVGAVNRLGEGPLSVINVTPQRRPYAPWGLLGEVAPEGVNLSWEAPLSDGGSPVTGYEIKRGTSPTEMDPPTELGDVRDHIDHTVVNGTDYFYSVRARNALGTSDWSPVLLVSVADLPLGPPLNLTATPGGGKVDLSWRRPAIDGGYRVQGYVVYRAEGEADLSPLCTVTGVTRYLDTEVVNNRSYRYAVSALNDLGEGPMSPIVLARPLGPPDAPQGLVASTIGGVVHLAWSTPPNDGGRPILGYQVLRGPFPDLMEPLANVTIGTTYDDEGVHLGEVYYYQVLAFNELGPGDVTPTESARPLTQASEPLDPAVVPLEGMLQLTWRPPEHLGGSFIMGYEVLRGEGAGPTMELYTSVKASLLTLVDDDVVIGTDYTYQVRAVTEAGPGRLSAPRGGTPWGFPSAPQALETTAGNGFVHLTWEPPSMDGGMPILNYTVLRGTPLGAMVTLDTVGKQAWYNDTMVKNGVTYLYAVRAVNAVGAGLPCDAVNATPDVVPRAPTRPRSFVLTAGGGNVILTWLEPSNDGGRPITGYTIRRGTSETDMSLLVELGDVLTYNDMDLEPGRTYFYSVAANNAIGQGEAFPPMPVKIKTSEGAPGFDAMTTLLAAGAMILLALGSRRRGHLAKG